MREELFRHLASKAWERYLCAVEVENMRPEAAFIDTFVFAMTVLEERFIELGKLQRLH